MKPTIGLIEQLKREQDAAFDRMLRTYNDFHRAQADYQAAIHRTVRAARDYDDLQRDLSRTADTTTDTHGA